MNQSVTNPDTAIGSITTISSTTAMNGISGLPIYYNNVRSIANKRNICMRIELSWYKVLCFTETWLDNGISSSIYFPSKFEVYRVDRNTTNLRRSGGVVILVHSSIMSKQISSISNTTTDETSEFLAVEIGIKPQPLVIYLCYMSEFNIDTAWHHYQRIRDIVETYRSHRILVVGDFNLHDIIWTPEDSDERIFLPHSPNDLIDTGTRRSVYHIDALNFLEKMLSLPLMQISNVCNRYSNVLDLVFVNEPSDFNLCIESNCIIDGQQQDPSHIPYEINVDYSEQLSNNVEVITVYQYTKGNYERMCAQLEGINFQHEFMSRDIDSAYEFFVQTMKALIDQNVPKVKVKKYSNKPKWWTSDLQRLRNRCAKLSKRKLGVEPTPEFVKSLAEFNDLKDRLYNEHVLRIQENIKNDPAEFWKFARINRGVERYPNEMHLDGNVGKSTNEIVNLFAEYFESIHVRDEESWEFDDVYVVPSDCEEVSLSMLDIDDAIQSLKWKSGAGPDGIKPMVIKMCSSAVVWPMWLLHQKAFDGGKIAEAMKVSRVVPVYKGKGDKKDVKNYRVVAIQPITMKVHETAINKRSATIVEPCLTTAQHGFRSKRSVVTNLLNLSILANDAFERSGQLDMFLGDFKTAFDKVWIRKLVAKFSKFKIGTKTAKWMCEYLVGRTNYVQIGDVRSRIYESPSGVPPGSSLGPKMFTIFINDIVDVINHVKPLLFADDIKLVALILDRMDALRLQEDINNVSQWCEINRLHFNKDKCYVFSIYRNNAQFIETIYKLGDHVVERKEEICDLGVWVNRFFNFGHHMEITTIKSRQIIGCIKHYSNGNFTKETQRILYTAYVRSRLEFASTVWNPSSDVYKDDIESIQKQFVIHLLDSRANATSYRLAPYEDRCKLVKLQNLELRRKLADVMLAYDIFKGDVTDDLISSKFIYDQSEYDLRTSTLKLLKEPRYSKQYLYDQPIARLIRLINEYKVVVSDCDNRNEFKRRMIEELGM